MNTSTVTSAVRNNRRTYGFATSTAAWAFSKATTVPAGFPALRPVGGLYTVEVIVSTPEEITATDAAADASGGEIVSLRNEV